MHCRTVNVRGMCQCVGYMKHGGQCKRLACFTLDASGVECIHEKVDLLFITAVDTPCVASLTKSMGAASCTTLPSVPYWK